MHSSLTARRASRHAVGAALLILALLAGLGQPRAALAAGANLNLTLSTAFPIVASGAWSVISLGFSCSSVTNSPCEDATVTAALPPALAGGIGDVQAFGAGTTPGYDPATRTVSWAFDGAIAPGDAGLLELRVRFPAGSTPDGATATLRAEMRSSSAPPKLSNPLTLTARAEPRAFAAKTLVSGGAPDVPTTYRLEVCIPGGGTGSLNLSDVLITDTLPLGATFVGASHGGALSGGAVTWPPTSLSVPGNLCAVRTVAVQFPAAGFSVGDQLRNDMRVSARAGAATLLLADSDLRLLQPPTPGYGFSKGGPASALVGDLVTYTLGVTNTGTTALDEVSLTDPIPPELEVTRITAGGHGLAATVRLALEYTTSLTPTFTAAPGGPLAGAGCVNVAPATGGGCAQTIALAGGDRITAVRWRYLDPLPFGFAAPGHALQASVTGSPVNAIIVNRASGSYSYNGVGATRSAEARTRVVAPGARATVAKSVDPDVVYAGGTVTYTLTLANTAVGSPAAALSSPVLADLLVGSLSYVPGSGAVIARPAGAPDPALEVLANYNATGRTLLRWGWDGYSLPAGEQLVVSFRAQVKPATPAGAIANTGALAGFANPPGEISLAACSGQGADSLDLDGDGNTSEAICSSSISSVALAQAANTSSLKLVRGQLDSAWTRDPLTGLTAPGGMADYQLAITNTNSVALTGLVLIDVLPWEGDAGVVRHGDPRQSAWRPYLIGPIAAPAGATVYYSTASNPCRNPELGLAGAGGEPADSPGCVDPAWSSVPPADITSVGSVKIDFGGLVLQPQDSVRVTWPMRAPVGGTPGEIAWNTFGYRARDLDGNYLQAAEPPRVGIERGRVEPPAYGNYVWLDADLDGVQGPGEPGVNGARIDLYEDSDRSGGRSPGDRLVGFTVAGPDDDGNPGSYLFSESFDQADPRYPGFLPPGDYYTVVTPPPGYGLTARDAGDNEGGADELDSDVDQSTGVTAVTSLASGEIDLSWDVGLVADTAVGNYVWIDRNANGLQDEPASDGVNGVAVRLFDPGADGQPGGGDDALLATTTTVDDPFGQPGYYTFAGLAPGSFFVEFALPAGFGFTSADAGPADALDSDAGAGGRTAAFALAHRQLDTTRDAGLTLTGGSLSLGDRVWRDADDDGRYEPLAGELGIDGVALGLYRDLDGDGQPGPGEYVAGTTTRTVFGQPGFYQFAGLAAGAYIVAVDPDAFAPGAALFGLRTSDGNDPAPDPDDDRDHDDNGALLGGLVRAQAITLSPGGEPGAAADGDGTGGNQTVDLGFIGGGALGDRVWFDSDRDGLQAAGEPGVAGVAVELLDGAGATVLGSTLTDGAGRYGFTGLAAGDYRVRFGGPPAGHALTLAGAAGALDSDPDPLTGLTPVIALGDAQSDLTWDAGLVADLSSLGDLVWDDLDRDGVQGAGEPGLAGVTATLYAPGPDGAAGTADDTPLASDTTDLDGRYGFGGLAPGAYYVQFGALPAGYAVSPTDAGADDAADSDADRATRRTAITTLSPGKDDPGWDLGLYTFASIGDRVWNDADNNGVQDAGEPGVPGVAVRLFRPGSGAPVASATTGSTGAYSFTDLVPGDYYLEFSLPSGYRASAQGRGGDGERDSDPHQTTYQTAATTLAPGESDMSWDFGIFPGAGIGDRAWLDLDADGVQDPGEAAGVPGVQVILYDAAHAQLDTTVTDAGGLYRFSGLAPGSYSLSFLLPTSYLVSPQDQGGADGADSDVPGVAPFETALTELVAGESDLSWDIGLYQPSSLGDLVWHDVDGDGLQDGDEPGVAGVPASLFRPGPDGQPGGGDDSFVAGTATDAAGRYSFGGLPPGPYFVAFGAAPGYSLLSPRDSAAATDATDSDVDAARRTHLVSLPSSAADLSLDMGVLNPAGLGDYVWLDADVDGAQDAGEDGVAGVTVTLFTGAGAAVATDITDAGGLYLFTGLPPGEYYVAFGGLPAGHAFTRQDEGDDGLDSDANRFSGQTGLVRLVSGASDLGRDAGIYETIGLGDYVWLDADADGVQDSGETAGVPGVRVELLRDGDGAPLDYTYTDAGGRYLFGDLLPGTYRLRFGEIPAGSLPSPQGRGGDGALDSDAGAGFETGPIVAASGSDLDYDLGLYQPASIGDRVWEDRDGDGAQDAGEPGIGGVGVSLSGSDGAGSAVNLSTVTAADGSYGFAGLAPGSYAVTVAAPAGYRISPRDRGDDALDSDADPATGATAATALSSGESDQSWDAGLYQPLNLGDLVWDDRNNNGLFESLSESGIDGVTVNLYRDENGDGDVADGAEAAPIATTLTAGGGRYNFAGLDPGHYLVELPASNFGGAGPLAATATLPAYRSSTGTNGSPAGPYEAGTMPDANNNLDGDDNGKADAGGVRSRTIALRSRDEPLAAVDGDGDNGNLTVDFGLFRPLALGDRVWNDLDNDRLYAGLSESGIVSVTVQLFRDANGDSALTGAETTAISTTTTAAGGLYRFDNLVAGHYLVRIPASNFSGAGRLRFFRSSDGGAGSDSATDPDDGDVDGDDNGVGPSTAVATGNVNSGYVTLALGGEPTDDGDASSATNLSVDFGFYSLTVGNRVWVDANNSGTLDGAEVGLNGVAVRLLYDANGDGAIGAGETAATASFTTSNGGRYLFGGMRDGGSYAVEITLPADYVSSTGASGMLVGPYEPAPDPDAVSADGDDNGASAGGLLVRSSAFTMGVGAEPSGETDTAMPAGVTNVAANDSSDLSVDFAIFDEAALGDLVWLDADGDGRQGAGETAGVPGVTVTIYDAATGQPLDGDLGAAGTQPLSATTGVAGTYGFARLVPGSYYLVFSGIPAQYAVSPQDQGADNGADSDAGPPALRSPDVALTTGNDMTWDLGLYPRLSIGNLVWYDADDDGRYDSATESGISGVGLELYRDLNGDGDADDAGETAPVGATTTGPGGLYGFAGLEQGAYVVAVPASEFGAGEALYLHRSSTGSNGAAGGAYEPAPDPDGDLDDDDSGSGAPGAAVRSLALTVAPSAEPAGDGDDANGNQTLDFGFFEPLSLGDLVWEDANNDGRFGGAGEQGIPGVRVELFLDGDADGGAGPGELVTFTTTGAGGRYSFSDLIEGSYIVRIPAGQFGAGQPLAGFVSSTGANGRAAGDYEGAATPDPDTTALDGDDNGTTGALGDVDSLPVALSRGGEPPAGVDGDGDNGNQSVDFGLFRPAAIGDRVWEDTNANGAQDAGEPGLPGVTVELYDGGGALVATTATLAGGAYGFGHLIPGDYYLAFDQPAGFSAVSATDRAGEQLDSDADPLSRRTPATSLARGETDLSWDMGVYGAASIGDLVWRDGDGDGVQGPGEAGIGGVAVSLSGVDGLGAAVSLSTTTGGDGRYGFAGLLPGIYSVTVTPPAGYAISAPARGGDGGRDSDADPATGAMASTALTSGEEDTGWDAGLYEPASIGDLVWEDRDADGAQGAGEPGIPGVAVSLGGVDGAGNAVSLITTTGGDGRYSFGGLAPGAYSVTVDPPAGHLITARDASADAGDSDADPLTGTMAGTTLASGEHDPSWDAGLFRPVSLGDLVFEDFDDDGVFGGADRPLQGAQVSLYAADGATPAADLSGAAVATQTTALDGLYRFDNLRPGAYVVRVAAPAGYASSTDIATTADADGDRDGDDNGQGAGATVASAAVTLGAGEEPDDDGDAGRDSNLSVDFGFFRPAAIGDRVWLDLDRDGLQDAGEAGVPGVPVELWRAGGPAAAMATTTDADGAYGFRRLPGGDYFLRFGLPPDFERSPEGGGDPAAGDPDDSDAGPGTGETAVTTLDPGEEDLTWDAGLYYAAGLGDRVWLDRDANGAQDAGEPGVAGVQVALLDGAGATIATDTTDAGGIYGFPHLPGGDYRIRFTLPEGYRFSPRGRGDLPDADSDADPGTGLTAPIALAPGAHDPSWDAGIYRPVSLGDTVWDDADNDGRQGAGEPGLGGVPVRLFADADGDGAPDGADPLASTTTGAGGRYSFDGLNPGRYVVEVAPPAGYSTSTGVPGAPAGPYEPAPSPDGDVDGDDDGSAAGDRVRSGAVTLWSRGEPGVGEDGDDANGNMSLDFGLFRPAALGSSVWYDWDGDGRQGAGEPGVPGVTVTLYGGDGAPVRDGAGRPITAVTDQGGKFRFGNLIPGDYLVGFGGLPGGYTFTSPGVGDDAGDSDADPTTGLTVAVSLAAGDEDLSLWAGLINPTAISLVGFSAERRAGGVALRWETGAEWEVWGFHILRSADGTRAGAARVTPRLIVARGGPQQGAAYEWLDVSAEPGARYSYWLEEHELGGATSEHGPVTPRAGTSGGPARLFLPLVVR